MKATTRVRKVIFHSYQAFLVAIIVVCLGTLLSQFFEIGFIAEQLISFVPYILVGYFCGLILVALVSWRRTKLTPVAMLAVILLSINLLTMSTQILNVYYLERQSVSTNSESEQIRVAFYNKLFSNDNYAEISDYIQKLNPDVLVMVEVEPEAVKSIPALVSYSATYHVANNYYRGTRLAVFSKIGIIDSAKPLADSLPYAEVTLKTPTGKLLRVVGLHTTAPISQPFYSARNEQLSAVSAQLTMLASEKVPTVVVGDHNLTPFSPSYRSYAANLANLGLKNAVTGRGLQFSWSLDAYRLVSAHIDQMFVGEQLSIKEFGIGEKSGSDHNLIWADLSLQ